MAFASAVLMFANSPQSFLGAANVQDSLSLSIDVATVYGRHISSEVGQTVTQFLCGLTSAKIRRELSDVRQIRWEARVALRSCADGRSLIEMVADFASPISRRLQPLPVMRREATGPANNNNRRPDTAGGGRQPWCLTAAEDRHRHNGEALG